MTSLWLRAHSFQRPYLYGVGDGIADFAAQPGPTRQERGVTSIRYDCPAPAKSNSTTAGACSAAVVGSSVLTERWCTEESLHNIPCLNRAGRRRKGTPHARLRMCVAKRLICLPPPHSQARWIASSHGNPPTPNGSYSGLAVTLKSRHPRCTRVSLVYFISWSTLTH